MNVVLRVLLIVCCLLLFVFVVGNVSRRKLLLRYSLLWLALALIVLILSVFPDLVIGLSEVTGFITPSNFVFALSLFFLLAIAISQTVALSSQSKKIVNLSQELALAIKDAEEREGRDRVRGGEGNGQAAGASELSAAQVAAAASADVSVAQVASSASSSPDAQDAPAAPPYSMPSESSDAAKN